jgi:hypothetical protein
MLFCRGKVCHVLSLAVLYPLRNYIDTIYSVLYAGEGEGFRTDEQVYDEMYAYFKNNRKGRRKHHHKMAFYLSAGKRQRIRKEIATEHRRQEDAARALASGRVPEKGEPFDGICCCSLRWSQAISGGSAVLLFRLVALRYLLHRFVCDARQSFIAVDSHSSPPSGCVQSH